MSEGWSPSQLAAVRDSLGRGDLIGDFIRTEKAGRANIAELGRQIMQTPGTFGYRGTRDEYHDLRTIAENPHHFVVIQVDGDKLSLEVIAAGGAPYTPYAGGLSKISLDDKPTTSSR